MKDYAPGTLKRYKTSLEHTRESIKWKYKTADLQIRKLGYDFIADYEFWLKTIRRCNHNTTMKYLANCKKIVLIAFKKGWIVRDPFSAFKMSKHEVDRQALSASELASITDKVFGQGRLDQVRDIFLFCCYTGLAYADVFKLKRSEIIEGIYKEKWIIIKRQKIDSSSRIPILPVALTIIKKYDNHPRSNNLDKDIAGIVKPEYEFLS